VKFLYPTCIYLPAGGDSVGISPICLLLIKLEWLGYCMVKEQWQYVKPFSSDTGMSWSDRQTDSWRTIKIDMTSYFHSGWSDFDEIQHRGTEYLANYSEMVHIETGSRILIWRMFVNWVVSTKFGLLIDCDLLKAAASTNTKPEVTLKIYMTSYFRSRWSDLDEIGHPQSTCKIACQLCDRTKIKTGSRISI